MAFQFNKQLEELNGERDNFLFLHIAILRDNHFSPMDPATICSSYNTWYSQGLAVTFFYYFCSLFVHVFARLQYTL